MANFVHVPDLRAPARVLLTHPPRKREDHGEDRYAIIGMAEGRLLYVAFTMRGERTRIISARGAEPHERRQYHEDSV
ncbi:MAG TPA: BrnT family toxin [Caulobacteraceae bacterium]|nr:BrnT family toxin [Caulobacteraceae bacterium]